MGFGFRVKVEGCGLGVRVEFGFRVTIEGLGLGFRDLGLRLRVEG